MAGDVEGGAVCDEISPNTDTAARVPPARMLAIGPRRDEFMECVDPF